MHISNGMGRTPILCESYQHREIRQAQRNRARRSSGHHAAPCRSPDTMRQRMATRAILRPLELGDLVEAGAGESGSPVAGDEGAVGEVAGSVGQSTAEIEGVRRVVGAPSIQASAEVLVTPRQAAISTAFVRVTADAEPVGGRHRRCGAGSRLPNVGGSGGGRGRDGGCHRGSGGRPRSATRFAGRVRLRRVMAVAGEGESRRPVPE